MQQIDPAILRTPVCGLNLSPGTLGDQLAAPVTLVAFLRHLGCMFCREMVADLRQRATTPGFPPVLLVTQSASADLADFFAERWPDARAVADPARQLYTAFDIPRAGVAGLVGPVVWACGLRARVKGHTQNIARTLNPVSGDPWLLSALYLVGPCGDVTWQHRAKHAAERPDYAAIPLSGGAGAA